MRNGCPFCDYEGPSPVLWESASGFVIEPINPVVPGHVIVVGKLHTDDFADAPGYTAGVMASAAIYAKERMGACNLITSRGEAATQTVHHLHVHLVPRLEGDGLALPWSPSVQRTA